MQSVVRQQGIAAGPAAPERTAPQISSPPAARRPASAIDLLTEGGDDRIRPDETTGLNRYGCQPFPDPGALALGSSTASVISVPAFAGVERLASRLSDALAGGADPATLYAQEMGAVRQDLTRLLGLGDLAGLRAIIGRSGTDLHHIAAQLIGAGARVPPLVIACEGGETGSGVGQALGGLASAGAILRAQAVGLPPPGAAWPCQVLQAPARAADGSIRPADQVDEEVAAAARAAAANGRRVLLILMDCSKTGLISPSVGCALALKRRFPEQIDVLVDACQMRLRPSTLRAYLEAGFLAAITGSKFFTGPTFSAALLVPGDAADRLSAQDVPLALAAHSARAEWPTDWSGAEAPPARILPAKANFGLLARWRAALDEMRPFLALDPAEVHALFEALAQAVGAELDRNPRFERVAPRPLDRSALGAPPGWDTVPTIHAFLLNGAAGPIEAEDTLGLYRLAAMDLGGWARAVGEAPATQAAAALRVQFGQPVSCGQRGGRPLSALRLCASARLATAALAPGGTGAGAAIDQALSALDKTAWLCGRMTSGA